MIPELSANTQAILLLTAPLIAGRGESSANPLGTGEYRNLARRLRKWNRQPADLLDPGSEAVLAECGFEVDAGRLARLLGRGFLLAQAVERWRTRAIWVVSRADADYPHRLKKRLGEDAPPVLYGCGEASILNTGGLAVVGSRNADDTLIEYTKGVGRLAAVSRRTLVSGGARGIDQASMRGALEAGGHVTGILGDNLERTVMRREYRDPLTSGRLVLACPCDPSARFHVGHAMQRNKLIYALADAALVVTSDYRKGGTWTGAVEQLDRLRLVPIYVRCDGKGGKGLDGLRAKGAIPWPNPKTPESLEECLKVGSVLDSGDSDRRTLPLGEPDRSPPVESDPRNKEHGAEAPFGAAEPPESTPADELFAKVKGLLEGMDGSRTEAGVAEYLNVSRTQAGVWLKRFVEEKLRELFERSNEFKTEAEVAEALQVPSGRIRGSLKRLVDEGALEKLSRPVRYRFADSLGPLFDRKD